MVKMTVTGDYFSKNNTFGILTTDNSCPYQLHALAPNYSFHGFKSFNPEDVLAHDLEDLEELMEFLNQVIYAEKKRLGL